MRTLNLGILAHVDAGKTTLTERLLFTAGAIDHVGSVDAGTTQTDSLDLERERGITIRSAVASFLVGDLAVNLVDTPGHPDFIAEVERVLGVLDGAVLVVSAVEGVQPQTPLLFRALQRLRVPTLIFVNKIDRAGADPEAVVAADGVAACPRASCRWARPSSRAVRGGVRAVHARTMRRHRTALIEALAEHDEAILRAYVARRGHAHARAPARAARGSRRGPGASTRSTSGRPPRGIGDRRRSSPASIEFLVGARRRPGRAPSPAASSRSSGRPAGERVAYVRLFAGTLRPRQRVRVGGGEEAKPTSIKVFAPAGAPRRDVLAAGEMATVRGLGAVRVGDAIGEPRPADERDGRGSRGRRSRPSCSPCARTEQGSLRAALNQLAEQDPLIDVRQDDHRHEIAVSLYGEVQKEVIGATLERDYGIVADFRETTTVCIERPARVGEAEEVIRAKTKTNITGPELAPEHEPVPGHARPAHRAGAAGVGRRGPGRGRAAGCVPLYLFKTPDVFVAQLDGVRPRGARAKAWRAGRSPTVGSP